MGDVAVVLRAHSKTTSSDLTPEVKGKVQKLAQTLQPGRFSGLSSSERDAVLSNGERLMVDYGSPAGVFLVATGGLESVSTVLVKMSRKIPVTTLTNLGKLLFTLLRSIEDSNSLLGIPPTLVETLVKLIQESYRKVKKQRQRRARHEWAVVLQFWLKAAVCAVEIVEIPKGCLHDLSFALDTLFPLLLETEFQQLVKEACPLVCFVLDDFDLMQKFVSVKNGQFFDAWLTLLEGADAPDDWQFYSALCSGLSKVSFTDALLTSGLTFRLGALILQELSNINLILFEKDKQLQSDVEVGESCFLALLACFSEFCKNPACVESVTSLPITVETVFSIHPELLSELTDFELNLYKFPSGLDQLWSYVYALTGIDFCQDAVIGTFQALINLMTKGSYKPPVECVRIVDAWLSHCSQAEKQLTALHCLTCIVNVGAGVASFPTNVIADTVRTIFHILSGTKDPDDAELVSTGIECARLLAEVNEKSRILESVLLPDLASFLLTSLEKNLLIGYSAATRLILAFCTPEKLYLVNKLIPLGLFTLFDAAFHNLVERQTTKEVVLWHKDVLAILVILARTHTKKEVEEDSKSEIRRSLTNHRPVLRLVVLRVGAVYEKLACAVKDTGVGEVCWDNSLKSFLAADALPNVQVGETDQLALSLVSIVKVLHAPLQVTEAEYQSLTNLILRTLETIGYALKSVGALETVRVVASGCATAITSKSPLTSNGRVIVSKLAEIVTLCCHIDKIPFDIQVAVVVVRSLVKVLDDAVPTIIVASSGVELRIDSVKGWPERMVFHVLVCMHVLITNYFSMEVVNQVNGTVLRAVILGFTGTDTFVDHQENEWKQTHIATIASSILHTIASNRKTHETLLGLKMGVRRPSIARKEVEADLFVVFNWLLDNCDRGDLDNVVLCYGCICHLASNERLPRSAFRSTLSRILNCPRRIKHSENNSDNELNFKTQAIEEMSLEILQHFPLVEPDRLAGAEHRLLRGRHRAGLCSTKTLRTLQQQRIAKITGDSQKKPTVAQNRSTFETVNAEYEKLILKSSKSNDTVDSSKSER